MKKLAIGIDIGGINTAFGLVDENGDLYAESVISTKKYPYFEDYPTYVNDLCEALHTMVGSLSFDFELVGIGIGAPNANYYTGEINNAANLPWKDVKLAQLVSEKFGIPVAVTNDANAAALGEMTYGAARGLKDFIMITLGTGVGSGIVINGQVVYGHDGLAGELGHVIIKRNNGRLCGCGRTGCLEAYCSATGVARSAREFLEIRTEPSLLRNIPVEEITSKDVFDAANKGDQIAKDIFNYTGTLLGEAMADMTVFSSPEAFILFGGLSKSGELLMKPLREAMDRNMLSVFKGKAKIILSELKEADAAVLGASALGWEAKPIAQA